MKQKELRTSLNWIVPLILILVIAPFTINFWSHSISNNPENWGQFGDYFGGLLNSLLSFLNLIFLIVITLKIWKIEKKRNKWTLQELARPLGQIICGDYEDLIEIKLKNCGLGPLIITDITIIDRQGNKYDNLAGMLTKPPESNPWSDFVIDGKEFAIAKDMEINIIKIEQHAPEFDIFRNNLRSELKPLTIEIHYKDIYQRPMPVISRKLDLFGRTLA